MNKVMAVNYDDNGIATSLSTNNLLKVNIEHNNLFQGNLAVVLSNYANYIQNSGNPWTIPEDGGLPAVLNSALRSLYRNKPDDLSILKIIRRSLISCPMCGGQHPTTLDHYLPQKKYPQYSIFAKNLVPACSCNSVRGDVIKGPMQGQRILHPYYDHCLQERIISVRFDGDFYCPTVNILNVYPTDMDNQLAVEFHMDNVVRKTDIKDWMISKWADLVRGPEDLLDTLTLDRPLTQDQLVTSITGKMHSKERELRSKNNWESVFFHGLLQSPDLVQWLTNYINDT